MDPDPSRSPGIRFTFRHPLILIVYLALLFNILIPFLEITGPQSAWNLVIPTLLISPPLLALLIVIIERAGPVKNWSVSFLLCLFFPVLVLHHDGTALIEFLRHGKLPSFWATLLLNAMGVGYTLMYAGRMVPRSCPGCQRRTLVRLMRLFKKEKRSSNTFWCASCGGQYWKDQEGTWRPERRTTWLAGRKVLPTFRGRKAAPGGRPEVAEMTDRPSGPRAASERHPS